MADWIHRPHAMSSERRTTYADRDRQLLAAYRAAIEERTFTTSLNDQKRKLRSAPQSGRTTVLLDP